jgi:NTE family protein
MSDTKKFKTGLVLSGGAAKGYGHLGVLSALYEAGYSFDAIAGTSVGSIIGALLADGKHPSEIKEIFDKEKNFSLVKFKWSAGGLLSSSGLKNALKRHITAKSFEELRLPLWVTATDLGSGKSAYFSEGELLLPILASCAIPLLFEPIRLHDRTYVDGGLTENLPAKALSGLCEQLIGVNVNPVGPVAQVDGWMQSIERVLNIAIHNNVAQSIPMLDLYIEPSQMERFHLFSLDKGAEMYEIGYTAAQEKLKTLQTAKV